MGQFFHSNVVKLHGVVTVGEPVSYTNIVCSYFVASISYRKLGIGLGMRLVKIIVLCTGYDSTGANAIWRLGCIPEEKPQVSHLD